MITFKKYTLIFTSMFMFVSSPMRSQESLYPTLDLMDEYFTNSSTQNASIVQHFTLEASIRSVTYNEDGSQNITTFTASTFENELNNLRKVYDLFQEPVVLLSQGYGALETFFCSVHTRLVDTLNNDTINIRSIQSFQLVNKTGWKIHHLTIQNENPWSPISEKLWPKELTKQIEIERAEVAESSGTEFDTYDPNRVYSTDEVDEAPVYPGRKELFQSLLETFDVVTTANETHTPFTIEIQEDGLAALKYVNDLSEAQIAKAKSFVNSMLIWYPAIKDKASVRCKLIMYIQ